MIREALPAALLGVVELIKQMESEQQKKRKKKLVMLVHEILMSPNSNKDMHGVALKW